MREGQPATAIHRADYTAPAFWIDSVDLTFDLDPAKTRVLSRLRVRRNADVPPAPLRLDGEELNLARVLVNGAGTSFKLEGSQLVLENLPEGHEPFDLEIFTTCCPAKNTQLSGLYVSQGTFFTQCEAEGFRRITYFLDRPDVMASYTVTLRADKAEYPVLLSNGNLVDQGLLDDGRHFARWVDPHKKPCYLFALVAGKLVAREQRIRARSGNDHLLQIFVRPGDLEKTEHAMNSLMASIAWDEARFGLPLDLERFMIVATSDFNMGAMENKGLNIFNTKYVLASQSTATDADFGNIESVVGHEYFHNWTGNRVTCRDWFQLSLKEGLTVFRDQEFSQDLSGSPSARAVKRIEDVRVLRTVQFPEDAGPMAHPVRPDSYVEINNFYTVTIYEKGAEVVRMMHTLVGRDGFAAGMKLYFERHDGQAVTCDDFAQAIADANPDSELARLLPQFKRWYAQAGTPRVRARGAYDAGARTYTLTLEQSIAPTPGQPVKEPMVIPVALGLLGADGSALPLQLEGEAEAGGPDRTVVLTEPVHTYTFVNVPSEPVPSLLRGFSAPVLLDIEATDAQLLALLAHDTDPFNRWEAGQRLALRIAIQAIGDTSLDVPADGVLQRELLPASFVAAMRDVLRHPALDAAFKELVLALPSEGYIAEQLDVVDPQRVHAVREAMRQQLAVALQADWEWTWEQHHDTGAYRPDAISSGRRALAGMALSMLCLAARRTGDAVWPGKAYQRFKDAGNMTDRFNALTALVASGQPLAAQALARFHAMFKDEALVLDKWFSLQAGAPDRGGDVLPAVKQLMKHPDFSLKNPNRARSLIFSYCSANPGAFHRQDAAGYAFWADRVIELDALNPQVAARLARALDRWSKLAEPYRTAARDAIARVAAKPDLSNDVREVVGRALAD
ncbi:aminopeptidase N [Paracidovorax citrulli]|uniref:Aminopeptidase N n=2 Tax=Paracidovorax citrulli TaxID=80869 RepID=A1TN90_PARC0|nr:aminopeptidase N [Paracidovorax citrulli]ABM32428.1 alanyl aminopeptidase [Paracidovorax citrulli AAC00-1]ATG94559.1 aminopeptidase N [Paracidovorax citrulli]PVY66644.1 alanyl aminopeptidase [Paracidovorax citrulli]REG69189.1 alanyl aminopeptidase [Paracidovorax citrulli]RLJ93744.1 alanyl aminopeptidase [Paracidovorax citrulli]